MKEDEQREHAYEVLWRLAAALCDLSTAAHFASKEQALWPGMASELDQAAEVVAANLKKAQSTWEQGRPVQ
jgi:hypothetical protein